MQKSTWTVADILTMMAKLRDPEQGCPWDKAQSFETIVPHTLEEAYEVIEAIESKSWSEIPDELGDLFFQIVFYCQLGQEQHKFAFQDMLNALGDKLYRRHPHVFGAQEKLDSATEVLQRWEQGKVKERAEKAQHSLMDDLPTALPALSLAQKTQKRAATVGFDWPTVQGVMEKVYEELEEVQDELSAEQVDIDKVRHEIGDVLFSVVNLARTVGVDAEQALRLSQKKFVSRFQHIEKMVKEKEATIDEQDAETLHAMWLAAKESQR
tara:strand:- start:215 stop:1015 length:801 start_codon:yes stop_codon:yes gene_type:complete